MERGGGLRHGSIGATPDRARRRSRSIRVTILAWPVGAHGARPTGFHTNWIRTMTHNPASCWTAHHSQYHSAASAAQITKCRYVHQYGADRRTNNPRSSDMSARSAYLLLSFLSGMSRNQRHADPPGIVQALPNRLTGDRHDPAAGLSRDRASQPRSDFQRSALAQPRSALPALPHDPRRGRASSMPLVERLSPARYRRPFLRSVQLDGEPCAKAQTQAAKAASEGKTPAALRFNVTGGTHDRNPPNAQDDSYGASSTRR